MRKINNNKSIKKTIKCVSQKQFERPLNEITQKCIIKVKIK